METNDIELNEVVSYEIESIDIYDQLGQHTGKAMCKNQAHEQGVIHKGVCVWILNAQNELLLQTRSEHVMLPSKLDISFSGHIRSGETSVQAAIREGKEELGIDLKMDQLMYLFTCREYGGIEGYYENEIDDVFLYREDLPIDAYQFCDQEVKEVRYVSIDAFKKMVQTRDSSLVPYETHYQYLLTALESRVVHMR